MSRTQQTAKKYQGKIVETYEKKRKGRKKWEAEDKIVCSLLDELVPTTELLLDCPCGTGRFIHHYLKVKQGVFCVDLQEDMLSCAREKIQGKHAPYIHITKGNILNLPYHDNAFHTALAIRIVNLLEIKDMQKALRELQRVTSHYVIFNIRIDDGSGRWRHPRPKSAVLDALLSNWELWRDLRIHEDDFRMYVLKNNNPLEP